MMTLKDFVKKSGFQKITLGLSGGIDSSIISYGLKKKIGNDFENFLTAIEIAIRFHWRDEYEKILDEGAERYAEIDLVNISGRHRNMILNVESNIATMVSLRTIFQLKLQ